MTNLLIPPPTVPAVFISAQQLANQQAQVEVVHHQEAVAAAQAAADALAAQQTTIPVQTAYAGPSDGYKAFIYMHESGNNPTRWNSSGCVGLGQACPASKLLAVCPNLDYACEDNWFTGYAIRSYGSWQNAYIFWVGHSWW